MIRAAAIMEGAAISFVLSPATRFAASQNPKLCELVISAFIRLPYQFLMVHIPLTSFRHLICPSGGLKHRLPLSLRSVVRLQKARELSLGFYFFFAR